MNRDLKITTAVAAALLAGACGQRETQWTADRDTAICTDGQGKRVADRNCQQRHVGGHGGGSAFLWYYLGRSQAIPYYGERAAGGSYVGRPGVAYARAPAGASMTRAAAVSRGGFGSSARVFGSARG